MTLIIVLLLAIPAFSFVLYPLLRSGKRLMTMDEEERLSGLYQRRDTASENLKNAENDYESGILSEKDYMQARGQYSSRIAAILKEIEVNEKGVGINDRKERHIRRYVKGRYVVSRTENLVCHNCGAALNEKDRFCDQCGAKIQVKKS